MVSKKEDVLFGIGNFVDGKSIRQSVVSYRVKRERIS